MSPNFQDNFHAVNYSICNDVKPVTQNQAIESTKTLFGGNQICCEFSRALCYKINTTYKKHMKSCGHLGKQEK